MKKFKKIIIFLCIVAMIVAACLLFKNYFSFGKNIVELRNGGFHPDQIKIEKGETVYFVNKTKEPFWPASDPHPSHDINPKFDPQTPINPNESWEHTFDEIGNYRFHNHLSPSHTGTVHVVFDKEVEIVEIKKSECADVAEKKEALTCWNEFMSEAVESGGVTYAMNLIPQLVSDQNFAAICHSLAHTVGSFAYVDYDKNQELDVSLNMSYCGFGFYHGFIETLFERGGTIQEAREFCDYLKVGACLHGIGHGVVDGSNKKDWGNPHALVKPGLELCDTVAVTKEEMRLCYSGAFHSLGVAYRLSLWGLKVNPDDPLELCKIQKEQYTFNCYSGLPVVVMGVVDDNFLEAVTFAEEVEKNEYAQELVRNLASVKVGIAFGDEEFDYSEYIPVCQSIESRLIQSCIDGFGSALVDHKSENNYDRALRFCSSGSLTEEQKRSCFLKMLYSVKEKETTGVFKEVCKKVSEIYRHMDDIIPDCRE